VRTDTEILGVGGEDVLEQLELFDHDQGVEYVEAVGGLYVQHGVEPETSILPESVQRTDCGAVAVDQSLATTVPGLFAAGDVRQSSPRTVAAALGDGVTACQSAARYLGD
jgi:thioredoxin reductase (NADPH)